MSVPPPSAGARWPDPLLQVDGRGRPAADRWTYPTLDPATGEVLGQVPDGGAPDVEAAIRAAHLAFQGSLWPDRPDLRAKALRRLHARLVEERSSLRELMTAETGLPASLAGPHHDEPIARLLARTEPRLPEKDPVRPGVVAVLTPVTSPLAVALDAIGPILEAGGTVVLKPAPDAAWTALELGRLAAEVLPPGVLNVVSTRDVDVAIALTTDPRVDEVHFTGSAVNGERVRATAGGAGKRVRLDTGGTVPRVVGYDEDLAAAVSAAAATMCAHAGQGCRLPATVVVPAHRYDEAVDAAVRTMTEIGVGDPRDPATVCGPVVSRVQRDRVLRYLALAEAEGGGFATGGHAVERGGGFWIAPTVVTGLRSSSRLVREEILGPVLLVVPDRM